MDERAQVVTLHNSTMKIDEIKELLLKKIHHTYLADFIEAPYIDEDKLNILLIIMNNTPLSDKQKRHWIVATMLVQIALDTHELVPVTSSADESEFKTSSRQLTVLAGRSEERRVGKECRSRSARADYDRIRTKGRMTPAA